MKPHTGWFLAALVTMLVAVGVLLAGHWSGAIVVLALAVVFAVFSMRDRTEARRSDTN